MFHLLLARAGSSVMPHFTSGAPSITGSIGACVYDSSKQIWGANPPATISVSWFAADKDASLYEFQIFRNDGGAGDVYKATVSGATQSWWHYLTGSMVEGGSDAPWTSDYVYKVKIVRIADQLVIDTITSAEWAQLYGRCPIFE